MVVVQVCVTWKAVIKLYYICFSESMAVVFTTPSYASSLCSLPKHTHTHTHTRKHTHTHTHTFDVNNTDILKKE